MCRCAVRVRQIPRLPEVHARTAQGERHPIARGPALLAVLGPCPCPAPVPRCPAPFAHALTSFIVRPPGRRVDAGRGATRRHGPDLPGRGCEHHAVVGRGHARACGRHVALADPHRHRERAPCHRLEKENQNSSAAECIYCTIYVKMAFLGGAASVRPTGRKGGRTRHTVRPPRHRFPRRRSIR